jgi:hypothetical protein
LGDGHFIGSQRHRPEGQPARHQVAEPGRNPRPNILWILGDQFRAQALASNGDPDARTPNLDRAGINGATFSNNLAGFPLCCPFRGSMLTNRYPHHCVPGHEYPLPEGQKTLADVFNAAGSRTRRRIRDLDRVRNRRADESADQLREGRRRRAQSRRRQTILRRPERSAATRPLCRPDRFMANYNPERLILRPDVAHVPCIEQQVRRDLAGDYAMIENLDWNYHRTGNTSGTSDPNSAYLQCVVAPGHPDTPKNR